MTAQALCAMAQRMEIKARLLDAAAASYIEPDEETDRLTTAASDSRMAARLAREKAIEIDAAEWLESKP